MTYRIRHNGFMLVAVGCLMVCFGCSSEDRDEEVLRSGKHTIAFASYVGRTRTAQVDVTNDNLGDFYVYAVGNDEKYMENIKYSNGKYKDINDNEFDAWGPAEEYYWPVYPLHFYAYTQPSTVYSTITPNVDAADTLKTTLFVTPANALENQEDFVAAYLKDQTDPNMKDVNPSTTATLEFNHYLTQITLKATNQSEMYTVKVDGAKIANMAGDGTYTFSNNTMVATNDKVNKSTSKDYTTTFTMKTLGKTAKEVMTTDVEGVEGKGRWYLIPQSATPWAPEDDQYNTKHGTYIALKVLITSQGGANVFPKTGTETAWMAIPVPITKDTYFNFGQGMKYTITLNFFENNGAGFGDPEVDGDLKGAAIVKGKIQFSADVTVVDEVADVVIDM